MLTHTLSAVIEADDRIAKTNRRGSWRLLSLPDGPSPPEAIR